MIKLTPAFVILGTILAVTVVTVGPCFSAEDVIYGCYKKSNGQFRIVNDQRECNASEAPISWNQGGLPGAAGAAGAVGPVGPIGPVGPVGPVGPNGSLDLSKLYTVTRNNDPIARYREASNDCFCDEGDIALSAAVSCFIEDTINQVCTRDLRPTCFPYTYVGYPTVLTYEEREVTSGKIISGYRAQCTYISGPPEGYSISDFPGRIDLRCAKP